MSYNPTTGKIASPVSIYDIRQALGVSPTDLGTLCKHANINMWAKYKPVQKNKLDTTGQWDFTNNRWKYISELGGADPWWRGSTNAQIGGIEPVTTTYAATLLQYYQGSDPLNGWVYNRPGGGAIQPYRLTDFAQYNHIAQPPLANFYIQSQIIQDGHFTGSALMSMTDDETVDYLSLSDFAAPSFPNGLYFGVMFVQNSQIKLIVTADTKNVAQVYVNFSGSGNMLPLGTYDVYPILCRDRIPITQTYQTANLFLTCPMVSPVSTQIVDRTSTIDVILTPTYFIGQNKVNMNIANDTSTAITNVRWYLTDTQATPTGGTSIGTIAANSSVNVMNVSYNSGQYFQVSFVYNGSTYFKVMQLINSSPFPQT